MAPPWLDKIIEILKLSTVPALTGAVAAAFLLFGPSSVIEALGLTAAMTEWRPHVGIGFVLCSALLLGRAAAAVGPWVRIQWMDFRRIRYGKRRLRTLSPDERAVLKRYLLARRRRLPQVTSNGLVVGLINDDILQATEIARGITVDVSVQRWAWDYLEEHPELVISDPAEMNQLVERTTIADRDGFEDELGPWATREERQRRDHDREIHGG